MNRFRQIAIATFFLSFCMFSCGSSKPRPAHHSRHRPARTRPNPNAHFQRTEVKGLGDPMVVVENLTDRAIDVQFDGPTSTSMTVPVGTTKRSKVPVGYYRYQARAKGAKPFSGQQDFFKDGKYTWHFVIKAAFGPPPTSVANDLKAALSSRTINESAIDGIRLGDSRSRLPPGFVTKSDGWMAHRSGWEVRFKNDRAYIFRFHQNFAHALKLYEKPEIIETFGQPLKTIDLSPGRKLMFYDKISFVLLDDQYVFLIIITD
jgi:hypothetical protein